eukprot:1158910-Pelagomonas_calceolata.AAC.10
MGTCSYVPMRTGKALRSKLATWLLLLLCVYACIGKPVLINGTMGTCSYVLTRTEKILPASAHRRHHGHLQLCADAHWESFKEQNSHL